MHSFLVTGRLLVLLIGFFASCALSRAVENNDSKKIEALSEKANTPNVEKDRAFFGSWVVPLKLTIGGKDVEGEVTIDNVITSQYTEWETVVLWCWESFLEMPSAARICAAKVWEGIEDQAKQQLGNEETPIVLFDVHVAVPNAQYSAEAATKSKVRIEMVRRWRRAEDGSFAVPRFKHNPKARLARAFVGSNKIPFSIFVHDPEDCTYISGEIVSGGFWESVKTMRILRLMDEAKRDSSRENAILVDVGANIGWYAVASAAQGFEVVAVEPAKYNTELLMATLEMNGLTSRVHVRETALSDVTTEGQVCMRVAPAGNPTVNRGNFQMTNIDASGCKGSGVAITTIDEMFGFGRDDGEFRGADIQVLKLDIEGYETRALRGARRLLRSDRPPCYIIMEHIPYYVQMSGVLDATAIFHELASIGYDVYSDSPHGGGKKIVDFGDLLDGHDYEFRHRSARCTPRSDINRPTGNVRLSI